MLGLGVHPSRAGAAAETGWQSVQGGEVVRACQEQFSSACRVPFLVGWWGHLAPTGLGMLHQANMALRLGALGPYIGRCQRQAVIMEGPMVQACVGRHEPAMAGGQKGLLGQMRRASTTPMLPRTA